MKIYTRIIDSTLAALTVSFFVTIALPLQTFLSNQDSFPFTVGNLLPTLLVGFSVSLISVGLIMFLSTYILSRYLHLLLMAVWMWVYIQVAFLGVGLPQIDGALGDLFRPSLHRYLDVLLIPFLLLGVVLFRKWLIAFLRFFFAGMLLLSVAFLLDYNRGAGISNSFGGSEFKDGLVYPTRDVPLSAVYSPKRNVIFLVLDNLPGDIVSDVFKQDPSFASGFLGFTLYENNIGMHESTARGVTALVTGGYLEKNIRLSDWQSAFYGEKSFLSDYLSAGYAMYVVPSLIKPFTNRRQVTSSIVEENYSASVMKRYTKNAPYVTLLDILAYRVSLWKKKAHVVQRAMASGAKAHTVSTVGMSNVSGLCESENSLYRHLAQCPIDESVASTLHFYHTSGTHFPIYSDGEGNPLPDGREDLESMRNYAPYLVRQLSMYFDVLKSRGLYDNSMIVVTTDHGVMTYSVLPQAKSALLMVKPFGSNHDMKISRIPTSHSKIAELMRKSVAVDLDESAVDSCLLSDKRKIRVKQKSSDKWWQFGRLIDTYDIIYDDAGIELSRLNLGQFETY